MRRYASKHLIFFYVSFNKYLLAIIRGNRFYNFRDIVAAHFGASVSFADLMIARIEKNYQYFKQITLQIRQATHATGSSKQQ